MKKSLDRSNHIRVVPNDLPDREAHRVPKPARWASPRSIEARPPLRNGSTTASALPRMRETRGEGAEVDCNEHQYASLLITSPRAIVVNC